MRFLFYDVFIHLNGFLLVFVFSFSLWIFLFSWLFKSHAFNFFIILLCMCGVQTCMSCMCGGCLMSCPITPHRYFWDSVSHWNLEQGWQSASRRDPPASAPTALGRQESVCAVAVSFLCGYCWCELGFPSLRGKCSYPLNHLLPQPPCLFLMSH